MGLGERKDFEMTTQLNKHLTEIEEAMTLLDPKEVEQVVSVLEIVRKQHGTVYVCGNGGSHTTASHFVNDLVKMLHLKAVAVGDMSALVYAYGNDNGWANMFSDPIKKLITHNDAVFGISCSGNSENVVRALGVAKAADALAVGLTGPSGDSEINRIGLHGLVHVFAGDIRVQEDVHLMICHAIVRMMQEKL